MVDGKRKPRMTLDDVLVDMRANGMPMQKQVLSECLKQGIFPFARVIGTGPTGRAIFLIMRRDYENWAKEYLHLED